MISPSFPCPPLIPDCSCFNPVFFASFFVYFERASLEPPVDKRISPVEPDLVSPPNVESNSSDLDSVIAKLDLGGTSYGLRSFHTQAYEHADAKRLHS